ncbi:hypothetical protein G4Y79_16060 [Phototrophicus methaneseepsis]|uniref:Tetratricopeptide repeat protein n=1 Tax=Phototrophicus methaneseepsis TaxID=2710758 RepID=A0A7S8E6H6_9CHLR|nr:tetratricopeptide repeat protein [Phototrophicus methaneseepsis]QPC81215.1 hypothetical protein G4Y79_16060 [Phototrophicus methaneseepsis]
MSDNFDALARKLITINFQPVGQPQSSAIFGSVAELDESALVQKTVYRIGMWPFLSDVDQQKAHAIWAIFGYLLDMWQDVTVYRLPLRLDDDKDLETYELTPTDSLFEIDDWQLDDLDENIALWGRVLAEGDQLRLTIYLENDLLDNDETEAFHFDALDWDGVVALLPTAAQKIADHIEAQVKNNSTPIFETQKTDISEIARPVFDWERKLFLHLWEWDWEDDEILADFQALTQAATQADNSVSLWATASAIARSFLPGFIVIGDLLVEEIPAILQEWNYDPVAAVVLADALWRAGYIREAAKLLENAADESPESIILGRKRALRASEVGDVMRGIQILQETLLQVKSGVDSDPYLYVDYGNLLQLALQTGMPVPRLINVDISEKDAVAREAIFAYEQGLIGIPSGLDVLYNLAMLLMYIDTDRFWEIFELLLQEDQERVHINDLLEAIEVDDVEPGIAIAEDALEQARTVDNQITLARLLILNEENANALSLLEDARAQAQELEVQTEIESLKLVCKNSEFEFMFGEAASIIDAGNVPSDSTLEFLEEVVEEAPLFINGYLVLARAYMAVDEDESAIEVLLDADKVIPGNPDVMELLAACLWETDAEDLAFNYLNKGLKENPAHVPLLLRAGRMLFDNEQYDDAKQFIARAEVISPRSSELAALRAYIAQKISEDEWGQ